MTVRCGLNADNWCPRNNKNEDELLLKKLPFLKPPKREATTPTPINISGCVDRDRKLLKDLRKGWHWPEDYNCDSGLGENFSEQSVELYSRRLTKHKIMEFGFRVFILYGQPRSSFKGHHTYNIL